MKFSISLITDVITRAEGGFRNRSKRETYSVEGKERCLKGRTKVKWSKNIWYRLGGV